MFRIRHF